MKHLKLFENFNKGKLVKFTLYSLLEETDDQVEEIYDIDENTWSNRDEAIEIAKSHDSGFPNTQSNIILNIYSFNIPFDILKKYIGMEGSVDISKMIKLFIEKDDWRDLYKYYEIDTEDILTIDSENKSTDDIINEVIDRLNDKFDRNWTNGFKKYTDLYKDEDGNLTFDFDNGLDLDDPNLIEYEMVTIRIANHTHNPRNGTNDLNVMVANNDKTSDKFFTARTDLNYNRNSDIDEIVNDIINYWK